MTSASVIWLCCKEVSSFAFAACTRQWMIASCSHWPSKTCIFVGDENQKLQRRGAPGLPDRFHWQLAQRMAGPLRTFPSLTTSRTRFNLSMRRSCRSIRATCRVSEAYQTGSTRQREHRAPFRTNSLQEVWPSHHQLSQLSAGNHETTACRFQVQQQGACIEAGSHNVLWPWRKLRDDSSFARRARDLWERPSLDTSSAPKQQVVWHDVLFRALLVHVEWDLKHELQAGELLSVVFKQTLTDCMRHTLEDDWQLLSGWSRSLGLPSVAEKCWTDWFPEFENHPAKKIFSPGHQQWIEFAAKRHALLRRGEVEPAATGSAHSAPSRWNMSSAHQTFTWRALPGTTRERALQRCSVVCMGVQSSKEPHGQGGQGLRGSAEEGRINLHRGSWELFRGEFRINCWQSDGQWSLAGTVADGARGWHWQVAAAEPTPTETTVGGSHRSTVAPEGHQVCHVGAKCCGHLVGRQRQSTAVCAVRRPSWPCSLSGSRPSWWWCGGIRSHNVDPSRYVVEHIAESESLSTAARTERKAWTSRSCATKRRSRRTRKGAHGSRRPAGATDLLYALKTLKRGRKARGGGSLDALATPLTGGLVVRSETQVFAAMVLVTLHFLSGCSPACGELVGFVKECLVVEEDLYVDPEATHDIGDPELFAQKHKETTERRSEKFRALYEGVLADVRNCLESRAGRKWQACHPLTFARHAPGRPFCMPRLPKSYVTTKC